MTHLDDRFEHHTPTPEGASAQVETSDEVRVTTPASTRDAVSGRGSARTSCRC